MIAFIAALLWMAFHVHTVAASHSCSQVLVPSYPPPAIAGGWQGQLVVQGLQRPRSIQFDDYGALVVVEGGKGISRLTFKDNGGTCLQVETASVLVNQPTLNHGLALSGDGKTLYASSATSAFAWEYDASSGNVHGGPTTVVGNVTNDTLVTRNLLMSKKRDGTLLVSRGSPESRAAHITVFSNDLGQIRAFDLTRLSSKVYDFLNEGTVLGRSLRNSVGLAEHPVTGGIYSIENSIDDDKVAGQDIYKKTPGDRLNFHGYLHGSTASPGGNNGYSEPPAVSGCSEIPSNDELEASAPSIMTKNSIMADETCPSNFVAPRLTFPAHQVPLDLKFSGDGTEAYVAFHGSSDKTHPAGYKVSRIAFDTSGGEPIDAADSGAALRDIMSNSEPRKCPENCFRPVGLAWDSSGRLWMSSDTTGEIYVLQKTSQTATVTGSGTMVTTTGSPLNKGDSTSHTWEEAIVTVGTAAMLSAILFA